jgi:hypothetical protein
MTIGELRALLKDYPDDAKIEFADGNFGGVGEELTQFDFTFERKDLVLISTPHWPSCEG